MLISIIVPCYNQAHYLDECLQSVIDQTFTNWECIIVNDGSPDNTEEVVKVWLERDKRFKYLLKENGGLSSARNAGINIAKGEWVLPLDADDKINNNYLSLASKQFDKSYIIIYSEAEFFGDKVGKWNLSDFSLKELAINNIIFCSSFFRKSDWDKSNGYDENLKKGLEDWEFWIQLLKNGGKVYKIPKVCFYYRIKKDSMLTALDRTNEKDLILKYIYKKHYEFFIDVFETYEKYENYKKMLSTITYSKFYKLYKSLIEVKSKFLK